MDPFSRLSALIRYVFSAFLVCCLIAVGYAATKSAHASAKNNTSVSTASPKTPTLKSSVPSGQRFLYIYNNCDQPIWIEQDYIHPIIPVGTAYQPNQVGYLVQKLPPQQGAYYLPEALAPSDSYQPTQVPGTRFWAKMHCNDANVPGYDSFKCVIGESQGIPVLQHPEKSKIPPKLSGLSTIFYPDGGADPNQTLEPNSFAPAVDSLLEVTWGAYNSNGTFLDLSNVDGYTLSYSVMFYDLKDPNLPRDGSAPKTPSVPSGCSSSNHGQPTLPPKPVNWVDCSGLDLKKCPTPSYMAINALKSGIDSNLQVVMNHTVAGCFSPCRKLTVEPIKGGGLKGVVPATASDPFCCAGKNGTAATCPPTPNAAYIDLIHNQSNCGAYAYAYDDAWATVRCPFSKDQTNAIVMVFCPKKIIPPAPQCTTDADCHDPNKMCSAGNCVPKPPQPPHCQTNADCVVGQQCDTKTGSCIPIPTPACKVDSDCGAGKQCSNGTCVPAVTPPTDCSANCPAGQTCSKNSKGVCIVNGVYCQGDNICPGNIPCPINDQRYYDAVHQSYSCPAGSVTPPSSGCSPACTGNTVCYQKSCVAYNPGATCNPTTTPIQYCPGQIPCPGSATHTADPQSPFYLGPNSMRCPANPLP